MSDSLPPHGLYSPWNSPGQNTGKGSLSLLQVIFPTQGSNPGLPHCWRILYELSYKGNPRTEPGSPALQADSLPAEPPGKPKDTGVGSLSLLQGIFPDPGNEPGSPALQVVSLPTEQSGKPTKYTMDL